MSFYQIADFLSNELRVQLFSEAEGVSRASLAEKTDYSKDYVSTKVQRMEKLGLVSEFNRNRCVKRTEKGDKVFESYSKLVQDLEDLGVSETPFYEIFSHGAERRLLYNELGFDVSILSQNARQGVLEKIPGEIMYEEDGVHVTEAGEPFKDFRETVEKVESSYRETEEALQTVQDGHIEDYLGKTLYDGRKLSKIVSKNGDRLIVYGGGVLTNSTGFEEGQNIIVEETGNTFASIPVYRPVSQVSSVEDLEEYLES